MRRLVMAALAAWLALPAVCCQAAAAPSATAPAGTADGNGSVESLAEQQYRKALQLRDLPDVSQRELKQAVKLLHSAAGIQHISLVRRQQQAGGSSSVGGTNATTSPLSDFLTASAVNIVFQNGSTPHHGALKELVYVYRQGDGVPANPAIAHRLLLLLAEMGNPEAQADVAVYLALGIQPVAPNSQSQLFRLVPPDVPAALLHYVFAANAKDPLAQMALGYRHLHGIDVPKSCQTAALYYAPVAEKVLELAQMRESLPQIKSVRLNHRTAHARRLSSEQEVLHYQWFADFGNVDAARAVAHMLSHGAARDYEQAIRYLRQAADVGDADAMAHLGHIYANGVGVDQDNTTAMEWFEAAKDRGHASGYFGLGYMYMSGHGTSKNYNKALKYLKDAVQAGQGSWSGQGDAFFYLGLMHFKGWGTKADLAKAVQLFDAAAKAGNMLAAYNLAMLHLGGHTSERSPCQAAVALLKKVAEKGFPAQQEANEDFYSGEYEWALLNYLKASEMGVELGQSNAAWMLTEGYGYEGPEAGLTALQLYKRAAQQGNMDALLRIGDGYWYGKGVARDWRRAAQMYNEAGKHHNAQALFNMGFMHQFGAGLPKDFHLAKRFYDRSLAAQPDAKLAVQIALNFLRLHTWWEGVEPRLPPKWAALLGSLFTLGESGMLAAGQAAAAHHQAAVATRHGLWAHLRRLLTLDFLFEALDDAFDKGDNMDLTLAAGLLLVLALVLWRRRMLRNQNQERQFVQAQPRAADPVTLWGPQGLHPDPAPADAPVQAGELAGGLAGRQAAVPEEPSSSSGAGSSSGQQRQEEAQRQEGADAGT